MRSGKMGIFISGMLKGVFDGTATVKSDNKVFREFKKSGVTPQIYRISFEGKEIRYIVNNAINKALPTIIFIHGAPGSANNYFRYSLGSSLGNKELTK